MKSLPGLVVAAAFAVLTCAVWAYLNRPAAEPPWPARIQGFSFSPIRAGEDPTIHVLPTDAEIEAEIESAVDFAENSPPPGTEELYRHVYAD